LLIDPRFPVEWVPVEQHSVATGPDETDQLHKH
jgi:hypothetical protein